MNDSILVTGQRFGLCYVIGITWFLMALPCLQIAQSLSIDQIIARAMNTSAKKNVPVYDTKQKTVRVGLDMIYPAEDWARLLERNRSGSHRVIKRQAIEASAGQGYWPHGVIHYRINRQQFSRRDVRVLQAAMDEWMRHTCVRFKPASPYTHNRIVFVNGNGCASNVGMSRDPQEVVLSRGCRIKGVVIHELGHVLGFNHEHTRPDRDNYVRIRWENIPRDIEYNFHRYTWAVVRDLGVPYDYLSIMHYGKDAFSGNGRVTIETRDKQYQNLIGNRRGLSFRDIKSANILYNCRPSSDQGCSLKDDDCPGEGFVSKDCTCWCPNPDIYTHPNSPYFICSSPGDSGKERSGYHHRGADSNNKGPSTNREGQGESESECGDQNTNCQMWAERGECQNNQNYMHSNCRKACRLCDSGEAPCRDAYSSCAFWQKKGYCGTSSPFTVFITNNCRHTCGVCKTGPTNPESGKTVTTCDRQCEDENDQCQTWAERGECIATSDYMLRYCRKACNACCT
ncbi:hypothetical protein ACOMHN_000422 [Nucella lapillus]